MRQPQWRLQSSPSRLLWGVFLGLLIEPAFAVAQTGPRFRSIHAPSAVDRILERKTTIPVTKSVPKNGGSRSPVSRHAPAIERQSGVVQVRFQDSGASGFSLPGGSVPGGIRAPESATSPPSGPAMRLPGNSLRDGMDDSGMPASPPASAPPSSLNPQSAQIFDRDGRPLSVENPPRRTLPNPGVNVPANPPAGGFAPGRPIRDERAGNMRAGNTRAGNTQSSEAFASDSTPMAPPQIDNVANIGNSPLVTGASGYTGAMQAPRTAYLNGYVMPVAGCAPAASFPAASSFPAPAPSLSAPPAVSAPPTFSTPLGGLGAPVVGNPPLGAVAGSSAPAGALLSLGQDRYPIEVGRGIIGQPKAYVNGQPIRNWLRYLTP